VSAIFKKRPKKAPTPKLNHHFVFIEASINAVGPEAMNWGESAWWPKGASLQFQRVGDGPLMIGSKFEMKVQALFGPRFVVEVTQLIPNRLLEFTYRRGFIIGKESIKIEERANGTRIDYEMHYQIKGLFPKILWPLLFEKQHNASLRRILDALKEYILDLKDMHRERQLGDR
jgi:hypothetical protein